MDRSKVGTVANRNIWWNATSLHAQTRLNTGKGHQGLLQRRSPLLLLLLEKLLVLLQLFQLLLLLRLLVGRGGHGCGQQLMLLLLFQHFDGNSSDGGVRRLELGPIAHRLALLKRKHALLSLHQWASSQQLLLLRNGLLKNVKIHKISHGP